MDALKLFLYKQFLSEIVQLPVHYKFLAERIEDGLKAMQTFLSPNTELPQLGTIAGPLMEYIVKIRMLLPRYTRAVVSSPDSGSEEVTAPVNGRVGEEHMERFLNALISNGRYETRKRAEYEFVYTPFLRGQKLSLIAPPDKREVCASLALNG